MVRVWRYSHRLSRAADITVSHSAIRRVSGRAGAVAFLVPRRGPAVNVGARQIRPEAAMGLGISRLHGSCVAQ